MADETADAAEALRAGEEFSTKKTKRPEPTPDEAATGELERRIGAQVIEIVGVLVAGRGSCRRSYGRCASDRGDRERSAPSGGFLPGRPNT